MIAKIIAPGGAHKHFLNYFIDRYSKLTPKITELPFSSNGTSHNVNMLSGSFESGHPNENFPYFNDTDKLHVVVEVDKDDIFFLERIVSLRAGDFKQSLEQDYINLKKQYIEMYNIDKVIQKLYNKTISADTVVPKFIMRDIKKLMFLNPESNGFLVQQKQYLAHLPNKHYLFPLASIWDKQKFFNEIKKLSASQSLDIQLDETAESLYELFTKNIKGYESKNRIKSVISALEKDEDFDLKNLDLIEQAYLSAFIEKNNDFVTIPLTNSFFQNTKDIKLWLDYYPRHYKAMNPNLPTFNNIPNPFYLWKNKK